MTNLWQSRRGARALECGIFAAFCAASPAHASSFTLHVGPPSMGTGGANPVSLPPVNPVEYEFTYVSNSDFESNLAAVPGLLFGKRSHTQKGGDGAYVSLGGGYVIDYNGSGPGVYSAIGYDYGKGIALNIELKQAIGYDFGKNLVVNPYAIRMGASYFF